MHCIWCAIVMLEIKAFITIYYKISQNYLFGIASTVFHIIC